MAKYKLLTSKALHSGSAIITTLGALCVPAAWIAGSGTFIGLSQNDLYINAAVISLVGIGYRLATIIHFLEEEREARQTGTP